jgi:hypothetical protein
MYVTCVHMHLCCCSHDALCADGEGWTPLHWAADHGHVNVAKTLVENTDSDVHERTSKDELPLHVRPCDVYTCVFMCMYAYMYVYVCCACVSHV